MSLFIIKRAKTSFPPGTFVINVTGAFLIGLVFALTAKKVVSPIIQSLIATGFIEGHWFHGILYLTFSILGGILAILLGIMLGQACVHKAGRQPKPETNAANRRSLLKHSMMIREPRHTVPSK